MTVFNANNTAHLDDNAPLFMGQALGIHDTLNMRHPFYDELFKLQKSIDWSEDEIDLSQSRLDFEMVDRSISDIMIKNLAFQAELDSAACRATGSLIAPFCTNSELMRCATKIQEIEYLHATTYIEIVRNCLSNPMDFYDEVYKNEKVISRAKKVVSVFDEIEKLGAKVILGHKIEESVIRKSIIKYFAALYALERIEFMASFAATFAIAERGYFLAIAALVQKIATDELQIHVEFDKYTIKQLKLDWPEEFEQVKKEVVLIIDEVVLSEYEWANYLFQEGRQVVGLTEQLIKRWVEFNAQEVYDDFDIELPFERILESPLPWMNQWLDINASQNANQEADANNYQLNSYIDDLNDEIVLL